MDDELAIEVHVARPDTSACAEALHLADQNRATLGFYPAQAFLDAVELGKVLVAVTGGGQVAGYLLYRIARERASITHLCTGQEFRRRGVARLLVQELRSRVANLRYLEARCRRDYDAHAAWKELGFTAEAEMQGRGRDRLPITIFRYDLGHGDLFNLPSKDEALVCALDTSVAIGLQDNKSECMPLLADWIGDDVEYVVTSEVKNDLDEADDPEERTRRQRYAASFRQVNPSPGAYERVLPVAKGILPPSSRSDSRHLARASAAGADVFVTTDDGVIARGAQVLGELGLRVLHPAEFVRELDGLLGALDYAPVRLAGTRLRLSAMQSGELEQVSKSMRYGGEGEKDRVFRRLIREAFHQRDRADVLVVRTDEDAMPVALVVGAEDAGGVYRVDALRVPPGRLSEADRFRVLARHLAHLVVKRAQSRGCNIVEIQDTYLHDVMVSGLLGEGFTIGKAERGRLQVSGALSREQLVSSLHRLAEDHDGLVEACTGGVDSLAARLARGEADAHVMIAERVGSVKVMPSPLPCYVVPIEGRWAEHLFDADLAAQGLFGADTRLGLARNGVYYRSNRGVRPQSPAYILWYVSDSYGYDGTKAVRACSLLRRVQVDEATELFRRNERLGVWQWSDVLHEAGGDPHKKIMALTFSHTELFESPIPYRRALALLGTESTFQWPLGVSSEQFMRVYEAGMRL